MRKALAATPMIIIRDLLNLPHINKTMAAQATLYGGHDNDFVGEVADRFICQICTKVLREPHLAVCCGQHFCESCLNKWFSRQQGRQSCPHCRAEGDAFSHVIHKGLRSEINQLKIRCINRGEGCEWTGELGTLKTHLESERGCGFVEVKCPNKCYSFFNILKRKDLGKHLTDHCYLRPYQCKFCGLKDTYEAITGDVIEHFSRDTQCHASGDPYCGHQAKCPEAPLPCPNHCKFRDIKRKNMENHRSKCPQEPVECPFAEAGCRSHLRRHQLEDHMTSSQQQHLMMVMKDYKETKGELQEIKQKLQKTEHKLDEALTRLSATEDYITTSNNLAKNGNSIKMLMSNFSEYHCSGKVWHSPPFYYREGYKMCLAVYANGVGEGAGTYVSVSLVLLRGCYDDQLEWPIPYTEDILRYVVNVSADGLNYFYLSWCAPIQRAELNELKEIIMCDQFCRLNSKALKLVNDCLTLRVTLFDESDLSVRIV